MSKLGGRMAGGWEGDLDVGWHTVSATRALTRVVLAARQQVIWGPCSHGYSNDHARETSGAGHEAGSLRLN